MRAGIKSVEHWLVWQTGLSPAHVKQLVDTARRCAELPFDTRWFTLTQATVLDCRAIEIGAS